MWLFATLFATAISWAVVQAVSTAVVDQPPAPLSHGAVSSELRSPGSPELVDESPSPSEKASTAEPTAAPTAAATAPPSQPAPPPVHPAPSPTPPASSGPTTTRTFTMVGGTAQLSCTNNQISLNWATPNQGYWVETGSSDSGQTIDVKFRSDSHESELQASCSANAVQGTVNEQSS